MFTSQSDISEKVGYKLQPFVDQSEMFDQVRFL